MVEVSNRVRAAFIRFVTVFKQFRKFLRKYLRDIVFLRITYEDIDALHPGNLLRIGIDIAAGDNDSAIGILTGGPADQIAFSPFWARSKPY